MAKDKNIRWGRYTKIQNEFHNKIPLLSGLSLSKTVIFDISQVTSVEIPVDLDC